MESESVRHEITIIFRNLFGDVEFKLQDEMTAADVSGWDSLMHVILITAIEDKFKIRFNLIEIENLNDFGELVHLTDKKVAALQSKKI